MDHEPKPFRDRVSRQYPLLTRPVSFVRRFKDDFDFFNPSWQTQHAFRPQLTECLDDSDIEVSKEREEVVSTALERSSQIQSAAKSRAILCGNGLRLCVDAFVDECRRLDELVARKKLDDHVLPYPFELLGFRVLAEFAEGRDVHRHILQPLPLRCQSHRVELFAHQRPCDDLGPDVRVGELLGSVHASNSSLADSSILLRMLWRVVLLEELGDDVAADDAGFEAGAENFLLEFCREARRFGWAVEEELHLRQMYLMLSDDCVSSDCSGCEIEVFDFLREVILRPE